MRANLTTGEKLQDLRKERGLTIKQVCDIIQTEYNFTLSTGKLNEMENDKPKDHGFKSFVYLAKFYNVSVDYLLGLSEIPSIPTDGKLQAAAEVTGLSDAAITSLQKLYENNNMTWETEILNMILESDEFLHILHYIEQSFTRPNKKIQYELLSTTTEDIGRTVITNYLNAILDKIREKFYGKQDYRDLYGIAHSLHEESKLTSEQYQRLCKELDMGDLSFFDQTFGK